MAVGNRRMDAVISFQLSVVSCQGNTTNDQ